MQPTPAATVVIIRDGPSGRERDNGSVGLEVLLVERNNKGAFGGMWVFPGGQVEEVDRSGGGGDEVAARRAAVREAAEETGVHLDPANLVALSWWLPPERAPRRFSTWFFVALMPEGSEVSVDGSEVLSSRWYTPAAAHAARDRGEIGLAPPTWMTLWWLSAHSDATSAFNAAAAGTPARFVTRIVRTEAGHLAIWEGDVAYDGAETSSVGPRRRLVMGPGSWYAEVSE